MAEFEEAAFNAPLNKVVRCKTKFGWHLLQVVSERYVFLTLFKLNILDSPRLFILTLVLILSVYDLGDCRKETLLQDVQPEEFHIKMQDPSFREVAQLLDVREPEEVYEELLQTTLI